MKLRGAASVLLTLVFCTAENNVPRWSRREEERRQGEWVPLNSEGLNQENTRIPSAISPVQHSAINHGLVQHAPGNPFLQGFPQEQIFSSQSSPQRLAFHPQGVNQRPELQRQISPQMLSQYLNRQIGQGSIPVFSRALLHKQPPQFQNPQYFQQEPYNIDPVYNEAPRLPEEEYNFNDEKEYDAKISAKDEDSNKNIYNGKIAQPNYSVDPSNSNPSTTDETKENEEIQILYVPVEMLKKQRHQQHLQHNANQANLALQELPQSRDPKPHLVNQESFQVSQKESKKFKHPIQPLKEQVPAYHLSQELLQGKLVHPSTVLVNEKIEDKRNSLYRNNPYHQRTSVPQKSAADSYSGKEQNVDESTIQDEVSDYRHSGDSRKAQRKDPSNRMQSSLPPPNQPPLSVFMETTQNNRIGDVLSLLKDSKTIPVLDSIGPNSPEVFVGPSNLNTPSGYIKYELPYLSSIDGSHTTQKLAQVPFFVAPLNFQPPPGFAKIPFPPPHIGSVVLSNVTNQIKSGYIDMSTPSSIEPHTANYKETFTIPADISSISPQLPSLINSLQEEEYSSSASSTETLSESTEEPSLKTRRPHGSRRPSSRGSYRASTTTRSTTQKPATARQRKPYNRQFNQRNNQYSSVKPSVTESSDENQYDGGNYYNYKVNREPSKTSEISEAPLEQKISINPQVSNESPLVPGTRYTNSAENSQQEDITLKNQPQYNQPNNPYPTTYPPEDVIHTNTDRTGLLYQQGLVENTKLDQPSTQTFKDPRIPQTVLYPREYQNNDYTVKSNRNQFLPTDQQQHIGNNQNKFQSYQPVGQHEFQSTEDSSSTLNTYDEAPHRKRINNAVSKPQEQQFNENINYRLQQNAVPSNTHDGSQTSEYINEHHQHPIINQQQSHLREPQENQHSMEQIKEQQPISNNDYLPTSQESSPNPQNNFESHDSYLKSQISENPESDIRTSKYYDHGPVQTNSRYNEYDGKSTNDRTTEPPKRTVDKAAPIRSRTRVRGKPHKQTTTDTYIKSSSYEDDNEKKSGSASINEHNDYNEYSTMESPTVPTRKFNRGQRRPIRPAYTTTIATTTTSAPPGTKYLIRTRKPTVAHTKLQSIGRGRIRRPTHATTTTTLPPTTLGPTYLQTLPVSWPQTSGQSELRLKETYQHTPNSGGYSDEIIDYKDVRNEDTGSYQDSGDREENYRQENHYPQTRAEIPRRVPTHSYESNENQYHSKKTFEGTQKPHYSRDEDVIQQRGHNSREYETTQRPQYTRGYETTLRTFHSREQITPKPEYSREYDSPPKTKHHRDYETTPSTSQYSRDYETTKKTYFREYEPTEKPQNFKEYVTQKQQTFQDDDTTQKSYNLRDYETTPKLQNNRDYETTPKAYVYADYETTQKPQNHKDYEPTQKSRDFREYEKSKGSQKLRGYDSTQRYFDEDQVTQRPQHTATSPPSRSSIQSSHRKRPSAITRGEQKVPKKSQDDSSASKDNDFWNQAVTIQQSQSYVFNPDDGTLGSKEESVGSPERTKLSNADYDDYYTYQDGDHYTSDQSPFASNDQHITYTNPKESLEIGKANQYPEKMTVAFYIPKDKPEHNITNSQKSYEIQSHQSHAETTSAQSDEQGITNQSIIPDEQYIPPVPHMEHNLSTQKEIQGGKRRGTWIRVRVKKQKDVFETAESQRFSAVRDNALVLDEHKLNVEKTHNFTSVVPNNNSFINVVKNHNSSISNSSTLKTEAIIENVVTEEPSQDENKYISTSILPDEITTISTTDSTLLRGIETSTNIYIEDSVTTVTSDTTSLENATKNDTDMFRTSTTTEISLETEICYKGQCIKTKRIKEDKYKDLLPTD